MSTETIERTYKKGKGMTPEEYAAMKWVIRARAKSATRYSLTHIKVTESYMAATDGKRLHTWEWAKENPLKLEPGIYEVVKNTKALTTLRAASEPVDWPNLDHIIPDTTEWPVAKITVAEKEVTLDVPTPFLTKVLRTLPDHETINYRFLLDVWESGLWKVYTAPQTYTGESAGWPVVFRCLRMSNDLTAMIMPMDMDKFL